MSIIKSVWLEKAAQELKGRSIADLDRSVGDGVSASPFACIDDFPNGLPVPLADGAALNNDWQIGETIEADSPAEANRTALSALHGGADALDFSFEKMPASEADFLKVFDGAHLDMISTSLSGAAVRSAPSAFAGFFMRAAQLKKTNETALRGAIRFDPLADLGEQPDWRFAADHMAFLREKMPLFKAFSLRSEASTPAAQIADLLRKAHSIFQNMSEKGLSLDATARAVQLETALGTDFLTEIAKLRALRLCWLNLLKGWQIEPLDLPFVEARFAAAAYGEDSNQNMIRAASIALSAAVGGAGRIFVAPFSAAPTDAAMAGFHRRIARNAQHLLKMESFVDRVQDPTAGSFYLETLTRKLASAAWKTFAQASDQATA